MSETPRKTAFYWASIAGADPEPVELVMIDGRKAIYTCGCGDPFYLDDKTVKITLGTERAAMNGATLDTWVFDDMGKASPMARPGIMTKHERRVQKEVHHTRIPITHSWRGPR